MKISAQSAFALVANTLADVLIDEPMPLMSEVENAMTTQNP
jgi:hypothetical protein